MPFVDFVDLFKGKFFRSLFFHLNWFIIEICFLNLFQLLFQLFIPFCLIFQNFLVIRNRFHEILSQLFIRKKFVRNQSRVIYWLKLTKMYCFYLDCVKSFLNMWKFANKSLHFTLKETISDFIDKTYVPHL